MDLGLLAGFKSLIVPGASPSAASLAVVKVPDVLVAESRQSLQRRNRK